MNTQLLLKELKYPCWILFGITVIVYLLFWGYIAALGYAAAKYEEDPDKDSFGPLWCGDTIADPIFLMADLIVPLNFLSVVGLATLSILKKVKRGHALLAAAVFVCMSTAVLTFGYWIFCTMLGGVEFFANIWWTLQ